MTFEPNSEELGSFDLYIDDLARHELFEDPEQEREIARRAQAGDREAARRLVEANLRFVISYVKRYQGRGLSLEELVSLGNVGMLKAVQKFDPNRGLKFITYAVWWIRQTVLQALAERRGSVRIPRNQNSRLSQISRTERELTQELGRAPTDRELAEELDVELEKIHRLRQMDLPPVRFDAPLDENGRASATLHERYAGTDESDLEGESEGRACREFLERLLAEQLTNRERKIVALYYGLDGQGSMTLKEIGDLLGVTRERVRQLRNRACRKLRQSERREALKSFWRERPPRQPEDVR